jgi:hypothetical protein
MSFLVLLLVVMGMAAVALLLGRIDRRARDQARAAFRAGQAATADFDYHVAEARAGLDSGQLTASWRLVLCCHALPQGGSRWAQVDLDLSAGGPTGSVEARAQVGAFQRGSGVAASPPAVTASRPLVLDEARELDRLLAGFPAAFTPSSRFEVKDGMPCDVLILRRAPPVSVQLECNLAVSGAPSATHRLCAFLATLTAHVTGISSVYGATSERGDITFGER